MRVFRFLISNLALIFVFSVLAFAQTETPQNSAPNKIAVIDSKAFENSTNGIQEIVDAYDKLDAEFKVEFDQLKSLEEVIKDRQKVLQEMVGTGPFKEYPRESSKSIDIILSKVEELELLQNKYKEKIDKLKPLYEKRAAQTVEPIKKKISEATKLFAKEKGYILILDSAKLNDGIILEYSELNDLTAEFIKYYNENFAKSKSQ